ncbi:hypothetical protein K7X08_007074 [Anisodus acutangulus]|uniref:Uncharacterized protein n=1 Tax=Anisodus acutangulus TaxID=402998 RepID=A0A9Q1QZY2_9SOLA|nr:hypothetical protein K7X08_007074 [Anisodus acutangulus]
MFIDIQQFVPLHKRWNILELLMHYQDSLLMRIFGITCRIMLWMRFFSFVSHHEKALCLTFPVSSLMPNNYVKSVTVIMIHKLSFMVCFNDSRTHDGEVYPLQKWHQLV